MFINKFNLNSINILIALIPFSLITGNLITNINIILIGCLGLFLYKKEIFFIENKKYQFLIYFFFTYLILITIFNNWSFVTENYLYKDHIIKSFSFLRFLILFLVVNKLLEKNVFNIKLFYVSCAFFSGLIAIDIIIQFIFNKNLIGLGSVGDGKRLSSFFGDELITGGYLQKFLFFLIFFIAYKKLKDKNLNKKILILFIIFFIPLVLAGNRMPTLIFILSATLFFIFEKKIKQLLIFLLLIIMITVSIIKFPIRDSRINLDLNFFFKETIDIITKAPALFFYNRTDVIEKWNSGYLIHFYSGIQIWKKNKIFGNGLKSFRLKCTYENNQTCNTHPHNYFIEFAVDMGLIGLVVIYLLILIGAFNFLNYYKLISNKKERLLVIIFLILILFEFFPFRSTGSFFTTSNSTYIFLLLSIFLNPKKILENYKK